VAKGLTAFCMSGKLTVRRPCKGQEGEERELGSFSVEAWGHLNGEM
jgi:hypothetical protein